MNNNSNYFDVIVIGGGMSGAFAINKMAKLKSDSKIALMEFGRPPLKRRRQLEGFLGCWPNSDGKLFLNDVDKITELCGVRKTTTAYNHSLLMLNDILENAKTIKTDKPQKSLLNKLGKHYTITYNNYIQSFPKDIHLFSKKSASIMEKFENLVEFFDNEVYDIYKEKKQFVLETDRGTFYAAKVVLATGRSAWRWNSKIYEKFGLITENNVAKYGVRLEIANSFMTEWNNSCLTLDSEDLEIGPFMWNGTIIPEDHLDLAICAFRSNEKRWETENVSFSFIKKIQKANAWEEIDRIGRLTFLLANDRLIKEKVSLIMSDKSKLSIIPQFNWLKTELEKFSEFCPDLLDKGYLHFPEIQPMPAKINVSKTFETDLDGLFVCGEAAGLSGLLAASITGTIVGESVLK